MTHSSWSRFLGLFLSWVLLIGPLPLSAIAREIAANIPQSDLHLVMQHADESYVYLGREASNIADLIARFSELDSDQNSPIHNLKTHIARGSSVAEYDAVIETLVYAESFVEKNYTKLANIYNRHLISDLEEVMQQVKDGSLTVDAKALGTRNYDAASYGKRSFQNIMQVKGLLSVNDEIVQNITAVNLSVTDEWVSGTLSMNDGIVSNNLQFQDTTGQYVALQAPMTVPAGYTLSLPAAMPVGNQVLRANATTPTNLEWYTDGAGNDPSTTKTIYVTQFGNDNNGNGSIEAPYRSIAKAIDVANGLASSTNPIVIIITSGLYVEDNSTGPLSINSQGISIVGDSPTGVIILPNTPANDLLLVNVTVQMANMTFKSPSALATGISFAAGKMSVLNNVRFSGFLVGVNCVGGATQTYGFNDCLFSANGTAINVDDTRVDLNNCFIFGALAAPAANTGFAVTGANANFLFNSGFCGLCVTGAQISGNATVTCSAASFRENSADIIQDGSSHLTLSGCTFEITTTDSDIDLQVSGAGTIAEIIGCEFSGSNLSNVAEGTAVQVSDGALVNISGGIIHDYGTALQVGISSDDTLTTILTAGSLIIRGCTADITQEGSTTLHVNACTASSSKISINDATNVELAFFDVDDNGALTIGSTADQDTVLLEASTDGTNRPEINYKTSLYSTKGIGFDNTISSNPSTWFALSNDNANLTAITTDRTKVVGVRLVSDEGSSVGGTTALRGWDINKNGSSAELSFKYQNNDTNGQTAVSPFIIMQLDGLNNQLQLPASGTQILFGGDTNLYRSGANVLKTDDNFVVGTLTPSRVVITNSSNQLASSVVTTTELGYVSGVTSSIQAQLDSKVSQGGATMTGDLQIPAGSTDAPSLTFTGSPTTGLSANSDNLSFSTAATERMNIDPNGIVSIASLTPAGVVHNDASGNLSSSLIVNADVDPAAAIADSKLATISSSGKVANSATTATSSNTANTIVLRDGSGNFSAGTITANLTGLATNATTAVNFSGSLSGDVTGTQNATVVSFVGGSTAANVNSATILANAATDHNAASAIVRRDSNGAFSAGLISITDAVISNSVAIAPFSIAGVVHNDASGNLSSSLIVNADIDPAAAIADSKLATISSSGKVANSATTATSSNTANTIVLRDGSGNFSAGTITASLSGNATTATTATNFSGSLMGDVTGTQGATVVSMVGGQAAADIAAATVVVDAATNLDTPSTLVERDANGAFAAGVISLTDGVVSNSLTMPFDVAGVVHNDASGVLSTSLIVNADIASGAAIADSKLATISSAGKVANSATTATSSNVANTIVLRDGSGNFSAGTITANLNGSASSSTNFSGSLMGDVTGTQDATVVSFVGGQTAANVAAATVIVDAATNLNTASTLVERDAHGAFAAGVVSVTDAVMSNSATITPFSTAGVVHNDATGLLSSSLIVNGDITDGTISNAKLASISSSNTPGTIVVRDGSGNFATNGISLFGDVSNPTDAATKAYVDMVMMLGIEPKTPAVVVSTSDTPITGLYTIDGVSFAANDRILLVGQADPTQNGLWVAAAGAWSRPTDFNTGNEATPAYVLITNGAVNKGSSYVCNTPTAVIDTDAVQFALFSLPDVTKGANVGAGTGLVYQSKTGITLNFRSLIAGSHITIANNLNDITLGTDATSANTPGSLVTRDGSGNFSAGTITANLNGNATTATTAGGFTGSFAGDVTGIQSATVVSFVGGQAASDVAAATVTVDAATPANTASTLVERSASGGFSAGMISVTDEVISNSLVISPFTTAGVLHNDVSGDISSSLIVNADLDPAAAIADSKLATISSSGKVANSATTATSSNVANAIVARDASGNFSAGTITANLTGTATNAALAVNFSGSLSGDVTGTQSATVVSMVGGRTAADVAGATVMVDAATNLNTPSTLVERDSNGAFAAGVVSVTDEVISNSLTMTPFNAAGVVHNDANGLFSSSLIVNADVDPAAAIVDTKLATISTSGKVANSATTATSSNTANTIVLRDGSGNFSAGTITANLTGLATNATVAVCFSGSLFGDVTGTQGGTVVEFVGGQTAANIAAGAILANTATDNNTACAIVRRDPNGAFSAGLISVTDEVISNSVMITPFSIAGIVHNDATGLLSSSLIVNADVDPAAAIVDTKLATISTPGKVANSATTATSTNTSSTIVLRDGSGNFSAGTITANLMGSSSNNVLKAGDTMTGALQLPAGTTALPSLKFTGSPTTGFSASSDNLSFSTAAVERMNIDPNGVVSIASLTPAGVVHNDASGNLSSSLIVNADVDPAAAIADSKLATISSSGKVANSATTATSANTANTIVLRDGSGNFAAGTITANLIGSASNNVLKSGDTMTGALQLPAGTAPLPALSFAGSPTTGLSAANTDDLSFSTAGTERMMIASDGTISIDAFSTAGVVHNDSSGDLSSSLIVNADIDANAGIIDSKLATISTPGKVANSATTATSSNVASTIMLRDASGNFSAGTANLTNAIIQSLNIPGLTPAGVVHNDVSGNLSSSLIVNADIASGAAIADSKLATISSAGKVANSATTGTNLNTANTLVLRDGSGSFAAQVISVVDTIASGNIVLSNSTSSVGNILKGSSPFIHNFGTSNTFVGVNAGNFTMSGLGLNTAIGVSALTSNTTGNSNVAIGYNTLVSNTTGNNNIAIGYLAGQSITTGSGNIYINADADVSSESSTIRIGTSQDTCFIAGINTAGISGDGVVVDSNGQLGITLSSAQFKNDIQDMGDKSEGILELRPVTFVYKTDKTKTVQYGLIAEEVDKVLPMMVRRDEKGAPYTVRYHMLPSLLLNEVQKQHRTIQQQQAIIDRMQKEYVTIEEMNKALASLQAKIQEFVEKHANA